MAEAKAAHKDAMERFIALQFLFDKQWKAVKVGCAAAHGPNHPSGASGCAPQSGRSMQGGGVSTMFRPLIFDPALHLHGSLGVSARS